jgi:hypothetical protein
MRLATTCMETHHLSHFLGMDLSSLIPSFHSPLVSFRWLFIPSRSSVSVMIPSLRNRHFILPLIYSGIGPGICSCSLLSNMNKPPVASCRVGTALAVSFRINNYFSGYATGVVTTNDTVDIHSLCPSIARDSWCARSQDQIPPRSIRFHLQNYARMEPVNTHDASLSLASSIVEGSLDGSRPGCLDRKRWVPYKWSSHPVSIL